MTANDTQSGHANHAQRCPLFAAGNLCSPAASDFGGLPLDVASNMPPACVYSAGDGNGKIDRQAAYHPDR